MSFNPNATPTLGLEWPAHLRALRFLGGMGKGEIERFSSSTTETIDALELYLSDIGEPGLYIAEVYPADAAPASDPVINQSRPRTDTGRNVAGSYTDVAGGSVQYSDFSIPVGGEAAPDTWVDTSPLKNGAAYAADPQKLAFRGGTGFANFTGKRILRVEFWIRWRAYGGEGIAGEPILEDAGGIDQVIGNFTRTPFVGAAGTFQSDRLGRWDLNPFTGLPWTAAEAGLYFSDGSTRRFGVAMIWNSLPTAVQISALWARVVTVDEERLAIGYLGIGANDGWKSFGLATPAGVDNWAKASATDYDVLLRRLGDTGSIAWPYLEAPGLLCPHAGHRAITPDLNGNYGTVVALGDLTGRAHPIRMVRTDAADSVDSQPYAVVGSAQAYSGVVVGSEFSGAAATGYGFVKATIRPFPGAPDDLADLVVKLKRQSDNVQLGGSFTITKEYADELPDLGDGWKQAGFRISTATLAAATGYYLEFTSAAGPDEPERWEILYLGAMGEGVRTYGGTTDSMTIGGFGFTDADIAATIAVPPATPSGFAVTLGP